MGHYTLLRRDFSGYFGPHFKELESQTLSAAFASAGVTGPVEYQTSFEACSEGDVIILTNSQTDFESLPSDLLKRVKLIVHANSGYDNISLKFVEHHPFPIVVGNELRAEAVATYVLSCLYQETSTPPFSKIWDKRRQWPRKLLSELNILILGHGHIGEKVANSLKAIGAQVQIDDPYKNLKADRIENADVLLPLMSLNPTSRARVDSKFLSQLKEDILIINAARGALIETAPLVSFLKSNPRARAYLDVFENEPADINQFRKLENVHTSSHVAGVYTSLDQRLIEFEARVIKDFLSDPEFTTKYDRDILRNRIHDNYLI